MKKDAFGFIYAGLAAAAFVILAGCGNDTVSPDPEIEPEVPRLQGVQINSAYFEQNNPSDQDLQDPEPFFPYLEAQEVVTEAAANLQSALEFPRFFLLVTSQREPQFENDRWVWSFDYTVDGALAGQEEDFTVDVFVTAVVNESADQVDWDFHLSGTGTPFGDLEDFRIFDASTNLNNSSGNFLFFLPENPDIPFIDLTWEIPVPNEKEIIATLVESDEAVDDESQIFTLDYIENETEFSLTLLRASDLLSEISWNSESETGSIENEDGLFCWGDDMRVADC